MASKKQNYVITRYLIIFKLFFFFPVYTKNIFVELLSFRFSIITTCTSDQIQKIIFKLCLSVCKIEDIKLLSVQKFCCLMTDGLGAKKCMLQIHSLENTAMRVGNTIFEIWIYKKLLSVQKFAVA